MNEARGSLGGASKRHNFKLVKEIVHGKLEEKKSPFGIRPKKEDKKDDKKEPRNKTTVALWQKLYTDYWKIKERRD